MSSQREMSTAMGSNVEGDRLSLLSEYCKGALNPRVCCSRIGQAAEVFGYGQDAVIVNIGGHPCKSCFSQSCNSSRCELSTMFQS